ncbi:hypothetical protein PW52_08860 [Tamlana sedimentorum]|uniref:Uncharacterized protein n=1 Tax=Neotamlana sedimentorum TaxID=1435349 RepID=A0A0D7W9J9_9FLAO|nr:tetratricopeptide repeat protein [Tamlana sedimentorum]KJD35830.1 hypothetical protein PW52_08860 [Tamlana sedimentorum]
MEDKEYISKELFEIIERYIKGNMTLKELQDINQLIELDTDFKQKVEEVKTYIHGIETQALKEKLDDFHEATKNQPNVAQKSNLIFLNFKRIAIAAAFIIGLGSIWYFSIPQNEKLYAKYYKNDPGLPTTMSSTNNFEFYSAMVKYKHGEYKSAIQSWNALVAKTPENDTLNYFIGVAHLANKNVDSAIPFLERTVQSKKDFPLINDANYYLGLAYLKEGNTELAKQFLSKSNNDLSKELILKLSD